MTISGAKIYRKSQGSILPLILVFGAMLLMLFIGVLNFLTVQQRSGVDEAFREQALEAAEAGMEYYRWRLAHAPTDYSTTHQIEQDVLDPQGSVIGHYSLTVTPPDSCSSPVKVTSVGYDVHEPGIKRTLNVQLGKPSLAQYAFLLNSNVWFGPSANVQGPIHSNGGVRMDGTQNALTTSALATYQCGSDMGCSPTQTKPGVWGAGSGGSQGLWTYPVPAVDFNALTVDLSQMKTTAQGANTYWGPSGTYGYEITLKQNDTYEVRKVTKLNANVQGWDGTQWISHSDSIKQTSLLGTYTLPQSTCDASHLLFFEDSKVWVDGVSQSKVTIVAAVFPDNPATNSTIIINGDIKNPNPKNSQIALLAQKDIRIPLQSRNNLEIDAVLIAQKGRFIRWYYDSSNNPYHLRNSLTILGTIVSQQPTGVAWGNPVVSGYQTRSYSFNQNLIYDPPPFLPTTGEVKVINWNEVQ